LTTFSDLKKAPGFNYGHIIATVCFIVVMMGWGIFYLYGIFFNPLIEEFGWSRATTSGAGALCILVAGMLGIAAGRLSDRLGPKKVIISCTMILIITLTQAGLDMTPLIMPHSFGYGFR